MLFPEEASRTFDDLKKWNPLINKTFFEKGKGEFEGMIRTYYMSFNPFANRIVPRISNWHYAEPTPDMKPYDPRVMSALTMQKFTNSFY